MSHKSEPDGDVSFRSKVDLWLAGLVVVALGGSFVASLLAAELDEPSTWLPAIIVTATLALVGSLSVPTLYTLSRSDLAVRSGLLRRSIPLTAILRVHPTRNPISSPAWSLDRLSIHYMDGRQRGYLLISPVDGDFFLTLLRERAHLVDSPRGLVRPDLPSA